MRPDSTPEPSDDLPVFLRWTDYLTRRSVVVRVEPEDAGAPVERLVGEYLAVGDVDSLVARRLLLPESAGEFRAFQDVTLTLSDSGAVGGLPPGSALRHGARELSPEGAAPMTTALLGDAPVRLLDVSIDRSDADYSRNWKGFNRRRWEANEGVFRDFVRDATGGLDAEEDGVEFLRRLAKAVWDSPFENYSRFSGAGLAYKTADETLLNIIGGDGAICSEKVQALKLAADFHGFESGYALAGPDTPGRLPEDRLRYILDTFDFRGGRQAMRYWQHIALEFAVDGTRALVDATNGNIPFVFALGQERDALLDDDAPAPLRVRMGAYPEDFYYHRAPEGLALDLCYAMENFIPEIDLTQVFDNELGLTITPDFLVTPVPFRTDEEFAELRGLYAGLAEPLKLEFRVSEEWELDGRLGEAFRAAEPRAAERVAESRDRLLERYELFEGAGYEMGLAIVCLRERE